MIKKIFVLEIIILSIIFKLSAQFKSPERYYDNLSYQNAIEGYKKSVEADATDGEALFNLANAYRLNSKTVEAEIWFEKAIVYYPAPICKLYYAQTLLSNSKYSKAKIWFLKYAEDAPSANDSEIAKDMADFCQELHNNGMPDYIYSVHEVKFNTLLQDYGPCFYRDSAIVFVSNRENENANPKKDKWTGDNYMQLYVTYSDANMKFSEPEILLTDLKTKYHEGSACFTSDNNTIYFTQNQYITNKKRKKILTDENQNTLLAIYSANYVDGQWMNEQKLPFNDEKYTVCHPAISNEETFLIFSSDMPGGFGGMDLYIVSYDEGVWGNPENMGEDINTVGNEVFPYLDSDNNLYYSSNMLVGFGGLDIYKAFKEKVGWSLPENIGVPINSSKDDFGLIINESWSTGYFSSNRKGEDNIYTFTENFDLIIKKGNRDEIEEPETPKGLSVCGTVINQRFKNTLKDAKVEVVSKCTGDESEIITLADGAFDFPIEENCEYKIKVTKKNFKDTLFNFSTFNPDYENCIEILVPLTFYDEEITEITNDLIVFEGQVLELYNIYYDFDKYNIRNDATTDLDDLYDLLIKYPSMKGELSSHTDSRGTFKYNETLSENRAKSAVEYLVKKGISADRLTYKGYGEYNLKNECADGVECNEIQHQRNRRTEFKITYLDETIYSKESETYKE